MLGEGGYGVEWGMCNIGEWNVSLGDRAVGTWLPLYSDCQHIRMACTDKPQSSIAVFCKNQASFSSNGIKGHNNGCYVHMSAFLCYSPWKLLSAPIQCLLVVGVMFIFIFTELNFQTSLGAWQMILRWLVPVNILPMESICVHFYLIYRCLQPLQCSLNITICI